MEVKMIGDGEVLRSFSFPRRLSVLIDCVFLVFSSLPYAVITDRYMFILKFLQILLVLKCQVKSVASLEKTSSFPVRPVEFLHLSFSG